MIIVNGEKLQCPVHMNLKEFLQSRGYDTKLVYEEKILEDGDTLEVVSFVGGG